VADWTVGGDLRARWQRGDPELRHVIQSLRELVDAGVSCLEVSDGAGFRELVDRNFDLRSQIFPISERDRKLVAMARASGGAAKLCGSGGAILGVPVEESQMAELADAYQRAGFGFLQPELSRQAQPTQSASPTGSKSSR
jgi:glucuronokinase